MDKDKANVLIKLARKTIEEKRVQDYNDSYSKFLEKRGAFVTLNKIKDKLKFHKELRGCIGFIMPIYPLWLAVSKAAYSAAYEDPRFNPLSLEEFNDIKIELSVLTIPKIIEVKDSKEYLDKIKIGRDGLIIERGYYSGVLLPQVPIEWNWNVKEFLENLCYKANMDKDCWKEKDTKLFSFQTEIFEE